MKRPSLKGQVVLVTGGAGFIGSHLVDRLLALGAKQAVVIDNMFLGSERNLAGALRKSAILYRDDAEIASSLEYVVREHKVTTVFNCAVKPLNYSFINPQNAFATNTNVVLNLLELQRKRAFKTLCHVSSSEVYGTAIYEPMDESHPLNPTTTYAAGKAAADLAVKSYVGMFGLDAYIVRPFNNYGPRQNHQGPLAGVIPATIARIASKGRPEIHGTGRQRRDFIYVLDTVQAICRLYDKMDAGDSVNVAAAADIEIGELIRTIAGLMKYCGPITKKPARGSDVLCHVASNAKLETMIDLRMTPLEKGLKDTITWLLAELRKRGG